MLNLEIIKNRVSAAAPLMLVDVNKVFSKSRKIPLPEVRFVVWYILHKTFDKSYSTIGRMFDVNHASVIHGITRANDDFERYPKIKYYHNTILEKLDDFIK